MEAIEVIIKESLKELKQIGSENEKSNILQKSKLIFPKYCCGEHKGEKRVSEQEARLLFIRELEKKDHFYYYSIETPTSKLYNFSDKNGPIIIPDNGKNGQSASFDLTLYKENKRRHFIEFKNGNVNTVKKDFLKLLCDRDNTDNFFINIVDRKNLHTRSTLKSIKDKYQDAINYIENKIDQEQHTNSTLIIILFNIRDGHLVLFNKITLNGNIKIKEIEQKNDIL